MNRKWSIGIEIGLRKTFTDYIDDVSTTYYNNEALRQQHGEVAAALADPNLGVFPYQYDNSGRTADGTQRGDKDNDSYMFAMITLNYKLKNLNRTRARF